MYSGLIAALIISFVLTFVTVFFLDRRGPWGSAWSFFLVLFLVLWAAAIYIAPVGPVYWGIAWVPLLIAGVLFAILLIASMPDANQWRDESLREPARNEVKEIREPVMVSPFFWVLIILLAIAIMIGMINPQPAL